MNDITMCSPTKLKKKCATCYRMQVQPDKYQSWANLSKECKTYYMPIIPVIEYNKRMDKIIAKGGDTANTLIALLDEAIKYKISSEQVKNKPKGYKRYKRCQK